MNSPAPKVSHWIRLVRGCVLVAAGCAFAQVPSYTPPPIGGHSYNELLAMGDAAVPVLMEGLSSTDADVRRVAADMLGTLKAVESIPALGRLAQSKEYNERTSALRSLGKIGGPDAATEILKLLPELPVAARAHHAQMLVHIGDNRVVDVLVDILASEVTTSNDDYEAVGRRMDTVRALGRFRDPRSRLALAKAARDDPNWRVNRAARQALRSLEILEFETRRDELADLVAVAVARWPDPPEGVEAHIANWRNDPLNRNRAWTGPEKGDFASAVQIERARKEVLAQARQRNPAQHPVPVVEELMSYIGNNKFYLGPANAQALLIEIGRPALRDLEMGVKRGDRYFAGNCQKVIAAILQAEPAAP